MTRKPASLIEISCQIEIREIGRPEGWTDQVDWHMELVSDHVPQLPATFSATVASALTA